MYSEYQYSESGGTYGTVQQVTYIYQAPASSSISGSSVYGTSSSVSGAGNNTTTYQQGVQRTSTKPISLPPTRLQDSTKAETLEFIKLDHHLEQDMSHHIRSVSPLVKHLSNWINKWFRNLPNPIWRLHSIKFKKLLILPRRIIR